MTNYEETLKKLENAVPTYLKTVGQFQWEGGTWEITGWHLLDYDRTQENYRTCACCNHFPIRELYYVTSTETDETCIVGNRCIDSVTNTKISKVFKRYRRKLERLKKNKEYFDVIEDLIMIYKRDRPKGIRVTGQELNRLYMMFFRLKEGKNLTHSQKEEFANIVHPKETEVFTYKDYHGRWRKTKDGDWALMEQL
jgi:hypothetical protein